MPVPPSAYRALNVVGYAGWAAIIVGLVVFLSGQETRGVEMMMGGAGAIAAKYLGTLLLVLLSRGGASR
jgi:hypothetical protein